MSPTTTNYLEVLAVLVALLLPRWDGIADRLEGDKLPRRATAARDERARAHGQVGLRCERDLSALLELE